MFDHSRPAYSVGPTSSHQWADGGPLLDFNWAHTWVARSLALQLRKCAVCSQVADLSKNINPSLVLVQPRKTRPFKTERLLMGRKESNKLTNTMLVLFFLPTLEGDY